MAGEWSVNWLNCRVGDRGTNRSNYGTVWTETTDLAGYSKLTHLEFVAFLRKNLFPHLEDFFPNRSQAFDPKSIFLRERKGERRCLKTPIKVWRNDESEKYNDRWFQHVQRVARCIKKRKGERKKSSHYKKAGINYHHHVYIPLSFSSVPQVTSKNLTQPRVGVIKFPSSDSSGILRFFHPTDESRGHRCRSKIDFPYEITIE